MNLAFLGFLPPASVNAEERTFIDLLSRSFSRTVVFQGIGVRALSFQHLLALPPRLMRRNIAVPSSVVRTGLLPILPIRSIWVSNANAAMIRMRLSRMTKGLFEDWVLWTRFPSPELVVALRNLPFARIVYEVVDNYAAEPLYTATERDSLEAAESELSSRAMVITASTGLAKRFEHAGQGPYWLPIGQDARLTAARSRVPADIPRPRLAVAGSLDELVDEDLLIEVASTRKEWHLVLAGPRHGEWGQKLVRLPNVHWLGSLTPEDARGVIADCEVALNPCVLNEWTADALPVKIFDYLAEGKPIVTTPMRELQTFTGLLELVARAGFVSAIERALQSDTAELTARRRETAQRFTLQERARRAFELAMQPPIHTIPPEGEGSFPVEVLSQRQA